MSSKVKPEILELSKKIATNNIEWADNKAVAKGDAFAENLPEDLSLEVVGKVRDYNSAFGAASGHAFATMAVERMAKDNGLTEASITFGMGGKDTVEHTLQRSYDARNPQSGETSTRYGKLVTAFQVVGEKSKSGQLGAVRSLIGDMAVEKLAKG